MKQKHFNGKEQPSNKSYQIHWLSCGFVETLAKKSHAFGNHFTLGREYSNKFEFYMPASF